MQDNYESTILEAIKFTLDNAPKGLREPDAKWLLSMVESKRTYGCPFYVVEWQRSLSDGFTTTVTLYVYFNNDANKKIEDAEGNLWEDRRVNAKISSYPGHGVDSFAITREHIRLISEVCDLAEAIEKRFSEPCHRLVMTKAERIVYPTTS